jgi:hypothetical protein
MPKSNRETIFFSNNKVLILTQPANSASRPHGLAAHRPTTLVPFFFSISLFLSVPSLRESSYPFDSILLSLPMSPSRAERCHARRRLHRRTAAVETDRPFTNRRLQPCSGSSRARWAPEDAGRRLERAKRRRLRRRGHRQWATTDETAPVRERAAAIASGKFIVVVRRVLGKGGQGGDGSSRRLVALRLP